jgi:hypothetical protein
VRVIGTVGLSMLALIAVGAAPAGATGSYPGETLSLSQSNPATAGQETNFVASGQQTDVGDYAGGFSLEVFAKNTDVDPTCSSSYLGEEQASVSDPYEQQIVIGGVEGLADTFSVPFKYLFPKSGQVILCAYSVWITDTAAAAALVVNIAAPATSPQTPSPPTSPTHSKPVDIRRPTVKQSGKTLTCSPGSWTGASSYAYAWLVSGRVKRGARKRKLAVTSTLEHRSVACRVTATNAAGTTSASSRALRVR